VKRLRAASRIGLAFAALALLAVFAVQYWNAIARNFALSAALARTRTQIAELDERRNEQRREIRRLQDPEGAVPEIHRLLQRFKPGETRIFLWGAPTPAPTP
jgi:cell division protein FtsB